MKNFTKKPDHKNDIIEETNHYQMIEKSNTNSFVSFFVDLVSNKMCWRSAHVEAKLFGKESKNPSPAETRVITNMSA